MKKTSLFLTLSLLFAVLLFPNGKNAGTAFNREGYTCTESRGGEEIRLTFQLQDYTLNRGAVNVDGKMCDSISYKHGVEPVEPGVPAAPYTVRSIIIPGNAEMTLEITGAKYKDIEGITLIPSTPARCDRDYPARCDRDYRFGSTYSRDQFYPGSPAAIGRPYILRNFRGVAVYFYPFRYNPVRGILRVAESITVTVKKTGTSVFNVLEKKESDTNSDKDKRNDVYIANAIDSKKKVRGIIKPFDRIYSDHFVNYRDSLHTESYPAVMETGSMMVITTDEYRSAVEPLVVWKNRKGIKTDLYIYPTDTGSSAIRLKDFIQRKYDSGGLAYILIVGDAGDVPPGNGTIATARGTASDPVYTLLAGDDDYADAMIGRFSVSDITQAQTVVNKNLWYEKTPDVNGEWYHKALGLAGDDRFFTPNPRELMEEIQAMMLGFPYTEFTMLKDPGCMKSQFTGAIEEGRGWININYHGTRSGWMRWVGSLDYLFSSTDVLQLENTGKTPVVISNSCSNGEFESRTCFAETWQRLGTPDEP
ncbi:MAG: hypothetical protein GY757_32815, partial [bacterium]|nr:hypothetical protein [bacterium]